MGESPCSVVANVLDCDIVVSEFKLQSRYYVHFRTYTFREGKKPHNPSNGLYSMYLPTPSHEQDVRQSHF